MKLISFIFFPSFLLPPSNSFPLLSLQDRTSGAYWIRNGACARKAADSHRSTSYPNSCCSTRTFAQSTLIDIGWVPADLWIFIQNHSFQTIHIKLFNEHHSYKEHSYSSPVTALPIRTNSIQFHSCFIVWSHTTYYERLVTNLSTYQRPINEPCRAIQCDFIAEGGFVRPFTELLCDWSWLLINYNPLNWVAPNGTVQNNQTVCLLSDPLAVCSSHCALWKALFYKRTFGVLRTYGTVRVHCSLFPEEFSGKFSAGRFLR